MAVPPTSQRLFAAALLDRAAATPAGILSGTDANPEARFAVYRNNVASGLVRALAARFPVAARIVGPAFFAGLAQAFVARHPPRSPLLFAYGDELPAFIEGFAAAGTLPYLADVARLEAACSRAYHAADASPLDPTALAAVDPACLPGLILRLHPAVSLIASPHPIVTIWAMHGEGVAISPITTWTGEDALVARPRLTVLVRRLPAGGHAFLSALVGGLPLGAAAETALAAAPSFDLTANLAGMMEAGLVTAIDRATPSARTP